MAKINEAVQSVSEVDLADIKRMLAYFIAGRFVKLILTKLRKKHVFRDNIVHINRFMRSVCANTDVDRFLIFRLTPDGYSCILDEQHSDNAVTMYEEFRHVKVDNGYIDMVNLSINDVVHIKVEELSDSLLKDIYVAQKVYYARIYFLHKYKNDIFFCSISTYKHSFLDTLDQEAKISAAVDSIRKAFKAYYN